ncbi:mitogen-activated protein kinase kinase kinase 9 [Mortierella sp. GBA30]|nr:mitogen-activated protein kinase kinase kinase 9 [Mortierella sp. GBA30]
MNEVGSGIATISSLVSSITNSSNRVRVNKVQCRELARECKWLQDRLECGDLGPSRGPTYDAIKDLLIQCDKDMKKFAGIGLLMRMIRAGEVADVCMLNMQSLEKWRKRIEEKQSPRNSLANLDLDDDVDMDTLGGGDGDQDMDDDSETSKFIFEVQDSQEDARNALRSIPPDSRLTERAIVDPDHLITGGEQVGIFPFGSIYKGAYKGEAVYVREIGDDVPKAAVKTIKDGIMLAQCLSDCQTIAPIRGICRDRKIVTDMPANGPLSEYRGILTTLQKVVIARKVADSLVFMHDIAVGKRSVVHRDIRAANVLLSKELEPMLTGFELCKGDGYVTGYYPELEEIYKKWWAPERRSGFGSSPASDVYSFGVLMYEISTGREPESGADLVALENNRLCAEYTTLMERCLHPHYNARPKMDEVMDVLLTIESKLA